MARKSKALKDIEAMIAEKQIFANEITGSIRGLHTKLEALHESITDLEVLAANNQPKPRKPKEEIRVEPAAGRIRGADKAGAVFDEDPNQFEQSDAE